jgi:hypothetical protein
MNYLIEKGVDINKIDDNGLTPLLHGLLLIFEKYSFHFIHNSLQHLTWAKQK